LQQIRPIHRRRSNPDPQLPSPETRGWRIANTQLGFVPRLIDENGTHAANGTT
jgi:hypothetical protein